MFSASEKRGPSKQINSCCMQLHQLMRSFRLLEKFKLFTAFYHLCELRSREDLVTGIVENLDYSM